MPTGDDTLVTVDAHVMEPTDLWSSRLPKSLHGIADLAPVYRRLPGSNKAFEINGKAIGITPEYRRYSSETEFVDIGPDDIDGHLRDMDSDGVTAEVVHPNAGLFIYDLENPDLAYACAEIYNDHMVELYESDRIRTNAIIPVLDADRSVSEIDRIAKLGIHGIELPQTAPAETPYYTSFWDPIWEAAQRNGVVVAMHIGTGPFGGKGGGGSPSRPFKPRAVPEEEPTRERMLVSRRLTRGGFGGLGGECLETMPDLIGAGVCERYPDLHFVFVEVGGKWLAGFMDHLDDAFYVGPGVRLVKRVFFNDDGSEVPQFVPGELELEWDYPLAPSDYIKRQMHVSFMDDFAALRNRGVTGVAPLLWGNDYPHYEGSWPNSREAIEHQCARADLTDEERAAIFGGTTAKLWGITLN